MAIEESSGFYAFAGKHFVNIANSGYSATDEVYEAGLSKREYFASAALQGLLSKDSGSEIYDIAKQAVDAADALMNILKDEDLQRSNFFKYR